MTTLHDPSAAESAKRQSALSQWDNEGGAIATPARVLPDDLPELGNAALVVMRIRLVALENLVVALLSQASARQIAIANAMAAHIAPRDDAAPHPLTKHVMQQMHDLVRRASRLRDDEISEP